MDINGQKWTKKLNFFSIFNFNFIQTTGISYCKIDPDFDFLLTYAGRNFLIKPIYKYFWASGSTK